MLHSHPLFICYNKKKAEEEINIIMNPEKAKTLAHELTMEYVRRHPDIMTHEFNAIVEEIADINQKFFDSIIKNKTLNNLY